MNLTTFRELIRQNDPLQGGPLKARFAIILFFMLSAMVFLPMFDLAHLIPAMLIACLIGIAANCISVLWVAWGRGIRYRVYFATFADVLLITIALHYLGGIEESFSWVYAVALIVIASQHGVRVGIYIAVVSSVMYSLLLVGEFKGFFPHVSYSVVNPVYLTEDPFYIQIKIVSSGILFFVTAVVSGVLSERLRRSKAELEKTVVERTKELTCANEQLRQQVAEREKAEERLKILFESAPDGYYLSDLMGRFVDGNRAAEEMTGYKREELIGKSFLDLNILSPDQISKAASLLAQNTEGNPTGPDEFTLNRKDGTQVVAEISTDPIEIDGQTLILGIARDVTQKKRLEQHLLQAQKMESIGTLAGGIAHDFNNLLGGILGYASLMKTKISPDDQVFGYADTIERSATRAAELTAQLLAFARGGKYETKVINLNTVVSETLEIISRTFDRSIEINTHLHEPLPTIAADAAQMQQVLMNLCVNARDAIPDRGKIIIETNVEALTEEYVQTHVEARAGSHVSLSVTDTGIGMDRQTMERIFEPFFTTKTEGGGTGLGLSMVYGVIKNHGGHVQVYSEPGEGSTFKVYLPVNGKGVTRELPKFETTSNGSELILVVDDEEAMRSLARDMLESYGYRVRAAGDGEEAIRIYAEHGDQIGLVIVDMIMPKMGGRETFLELKRLNPHIKVLLSTGYSQNGKAQEILDSGVMGFIQKPYQVATLLAKVRSVLDAKVSL